MLPKYVFSKRSTDEMIHPTMVLVRLICLLLLFVMMNTWLTFIRTNVSTFIYARIVQVFTSNVVFYRKSRRFNAALLFKLPRSVNWLQHCIQFVSKAWIYVSCVHWKIHIVKETCVGSEHVLMCSMVKSARMRHFWWIALIYEFKYFWLWVVDFLEVVLIGKNKWA